MSYAITNHDDILRFRMLTIVKAIELHAKHGMWPSRNMPRVKDLNRQYHLNCKTYAQVRVALLAKLEKGESK